MICPLTPQKRSGAMPQAEKHTAKKEAARLQGTQQGHLIKP